MGILLKEEENEGTVCKIGRNKFWVALHSTCSTESSKCGGGGCGSCSGTSKVQKVLIPLTNRAEYRLGQHVRFRHHLLNPGLVAMIVFGLPVVCALLAMIVWNIVSPQSAESPVAIVTYGLAFLGAFFLIGLFDFIFRRSYPIVVLTKQPDAENDVKE